MENLSKQSNYIPSACNTPSIPPTAGMAGTTPDSLLHLITGNKSATDLQKQQLIKDQIISNFKTRDEKKQLLADGLEESGLYKIARKVRACNERFNVFLTTACECSRVYPHSCNNRLCPHCASKRAKRLEVRALEIYELMSSPKQFVFTVPSCSNLSDGLNLLKDSFTRFRHRKAYKIRCSGGFYCYEITHGDAGWHPHIHYLADCEYWDQDELSKEFASCGGGKIVWIGKADKKTARYLCKYIAKVGERVTDPDLLHELYWSIKGRRLAGAVGKYYGIYQELGKEENNAEMETHCEHGNEFEWVGICKKDDVELNINGQRIRLKPDIQRRMKIDWAERFREVQMSRQFRRKISRSQQKNRNEVLIPCPKCGYKRQIDLTNGRANGICRGCGTRYILGTGPDMFALEQ